MSASSVVVVFFVVSTPAAFAIGTGTLVTDVSVSASLLDSKCDFAGDPVNTTDDPVLATYLQRGMHCAIGNDAPAFGGGELCGGCYRITATTSTGTNGDKVVTGEPNSEGVVVMVSTGGITGTGRFDCFWEAYQAITLASERAEWGIEFERTECEEIVTTPNVVNFGDMNEHYCHMVFQNVGGWGTLSGVEACLTKDDGAVECSAMSRIGASSAWSNCPKGSGSSITFELKQTDLQGSESSVDCICRGSAQGQASYWPWPKGSSCLCGVNFGPGGERISLSETSTTSTMTTTTKTFKDADPANQGGGASGLMDSGAPGDRSAPLVLAGVVCLFLAKLQQPR